MLLTSLLKWTFNTQPVKASEIILINADGRVYPSDAPISTVDNFTYTFTNNINGSIVIERNNIVVDGAGYTLQGTGSGIGIGLSYRSNVTIKSTKIKAFSNGIYLYSSSNNSITGNNITNNPLSIVIGSYSHNNSILRNSIRNKDLGGINNGIFFDENSYNNSVSENDVTNNDIGIHLDHSSNNTINRNNIATNSRWGLLIYDFDTFNPNGSSNNKIYHNNFINNTQQAYIWRAAQYIWSYRMYGNSWDNGYTFGGNYWNDYRGCDVYSGVYQNGTGFDWIGDSLYVIDEDNQDNYPLMYPFVPEMEEIRIAYRNLLWRYTEVQGEYDSLLAKINDIQEQINSLNLTCDNLRDQIESLNSTVTSKQEAVINELSAFKNITYMFITTTIILIATTVYFATRKPKVKTA